MRDKTIFIIMILLTVNFLNSGQYKSERTVKITKANDNCNTVLTFIDSSGDDRYDLAVEKFCDGCTRKVPVVIKTKYKNDPVPTEGLVNVLYESCGKEETNNCQKLKEAQGLIDKDRTHQHDINFELTFFDPANNVVAVVTKKCDSDTIFITGAMCMIKFKDE